MNMPMSTEKERDFYQRIITHLVGHKTKFLMGGTFALQQYTGVHRTTKDLDIFCREEDYPHILYSLSTAGYQTELTSSRWLVKVYEDRKFIDFIFSDPLGLFKVTDKWFTRARKGEILGHNVNLISPEDMMISKMYRQKRLIFDGPDVLHLMLKQGKTMDWKYILATLGPHWELLLSFIVLFAFVYPNDKQNVPGKIVMDLVDRFKNEYKNKPGRDKISRGFLINQNGDDYNIDVSEWGYTPIRTHE